VLKCTVIVYVIGGYEVLSKIMCFGTLPSPYITVLIHSAEN